MSFDIAYNIQAIDNFSRTSEKIASSIDKLESRVARFQNRVRKAGKSLGDLGKKMMLRVTAPLMIFGGLALKSASNIEDMNVAFEGMLHSSAKAKVMVKSLVDFAARTPFHLKDVQGAVQQLLEFGFSTKQTMATLKKLSDISALTHVPLSNLAQVFGRVTLRGKATARELMALTNMRVPLVKTLKDMAAHAGHANVDIYKLAATGAITKKVFLAAFKKMTTGTGIFTNAAEKQAHTLSGLFSTLTDNINLALVPIGNMIIDSLNLKKNMQKLIDFLGRLSKKMEVFGKSHKKLARVIVIASLIAAALAPILIALGTMIILTGFLAAGFTSIWAAIFTPITLAVVVIGSIVALFVYLYKHMQSVRLVLNTIWGILKVIWKVVETIVGLFLKLFNLVNKGLFLAFKKIASIVMNLIVHPIMKMIKGIESIFSLFSKHKGTIDMKKSVMLKQAQPNMRQDFAPLLMPQQRVRSDLNISLHDPGKNVARMYGKSDGGDLGFNLGANMLTSY